MLSIPALFSNPRQSDPLSRWIPYSLFLDENVFATKTGPIGMTMELDGLEYETLSQGQLERSAERFVSALRPLDSRFRIYHHMLKRDGQMISRKSRYEDPVVNRAIGERIDYLERSGSYSIRLFTTILLETDVVKLKGRKSLSEEALSDAAAKQIQESIRTLRDTVSAYAASLGSLLGVTILDRFGVFEHLALLVNPETGSIPRLKHKEHLDYFAANTEIEKERRHICWGDYEARVLTLKEEPSFTFAHMMRSLLKIESNLTLCCEWKKQSTLAMTHKLRNKRRLIWGQRYGATQKADLATADQASTDRAKLLNDTLAQVQAGGHSLGLFSMTAVVFDQDTDRLRQAVSKLHTCFQEREATLLEERRHRLRSFFAVIPGNQHLNIRYRYLLDSNYADLAPHYRSKDGSEFNTHLDDEYLTVLQSADGTPYYLNLHDEKVAATLVTGTTGSGKSVLLNKLIEDSQKYEGVRTFIVDIGGSYRSITKKYGGEYLSVSLKEKNFRRNPFRQAYTPRNVNAIKQLILAFLANENYHPDSREQQEIQEAVHEVYGLSEGRRRLGRISLSKNLKQALHLWINNGPFAHFFDNEEEDQSVNRWSTWDYTDLEEMPQVLGPLMYYQFHWISNIVRDPALASYPKAFWVDEGWRFGGSRMADLIRTAAKTWRKHNAWVVFATQDEEDLRRSELLEVLNSNCHTKIFLPNPGADLAVYGSTFKLSEREQELLGEMSTGEMLIKRKKESVRVRLKLSPSWLEEYQSQFGGEEALDLIEA
jgi:type IV secretion/conjugal transfer VirB4 family ATPase